MDDDIYRIMAEEIKKELDKQILESIWKEVADWLPVGNSQYSIKTKSKVDHWVNQHSDSEYSIVKFGDRFIIYEFSEQLETWFLLRWS